MAGLGVVSVAGKGPNGNVTTTGGGPSGFIAIGGSVAPGLVLAGTAQAWSITNTLERGPYSKATIATDTRSAPASGKAAATFSELGVLVDWFPNPSGGWHAGLSAGVGFTNLINQADDSTWHGTSVAGGVFGGYDWAIAPGWSLGLDLLATGSTNATLKDTSDSSDTGYRLRSLSVGLAASMLHF